MSDTENTVTAKPKAAKVVKKTKPAKKTEKKEKSGYGINYLAEQLNKKANLIRIQLRNKNIKKPGKSYTWPTKSEADDVIKKLKVAA